jgi:two-component system C4-dicarboxylate transport sensor histidine kinase DctB
VLINLMRNAIDADAGAPQRKSVRARPRRWQRVILTVTDTGPGIRADILPRLFEPFVTSKPAGAGLGLGLVISASSCEVSAARSRLATATKAGPIHNRSAPWQTSNEQSAVSKRFPYACC